MERQPGLRERKKEQTRHRLTQVAAALFADRGFDRVSIAEIARTAEVSEATVFNYFPTKEDLVYAGMETYESHLLEAVRTRDTDTSVVGAFREFVLQPPHRLSAADAQLLAEIATLARVIADSAALRSREQEVFDRSVEALAQLVAEEGGAGEDDLEPWVVANALMGVHRGMTRAVHRGARAGRTGAQIADEVLDQGRRALDVLQRGLDR